MASYDGDIDCRSDEDEDDGKSPVYATRSSARSVKQPTLTGNDIAVIYSILRPKLTSQAKSIASLTGKGLRANKTVLLGIGYKSHLSTHTNTSGRISLQWQLGEIWLSMILSKICTSLSMWQTARCAS